MYERKCIHMYVSRYVCMYLGGRGRSTEKRQRWGGREWERDVCMDRLPALTHSSVAFISYYILWHSLPRSSTIPFTSSFSIQFQSSINKTTALILLHCIWHEWMEPNESFSLIFHVFLPDCTLKNFYVHWSISINLFSHVGGTLFPLKKIKKCSSIVSNNYFPSKY